MEWNSIGSGGYLAIIIVEVVFIRRCRINSLGRKWTLDALNVPSTRKRRVNHASFQERILETSRLAKNQNNKRADVLFLPFPASSRRVDCTQKLLSSFVYFFPGNVHRGLVSNTSTDRKTVTQHIDFFFPTPQKRLGGILPFLFGLCGEVRV